MVSAIHCMLWRDLLYVLGPVAAIPGALAFGIALKPSDASFESPGGRRPGTCGAHLEGGAMVNARDLIDLRGRVAAITIVLSYGIGAHVDRPARFPEARPW